MKEQRAAKVAELNGLLKHNKLDLPAFRKEVTVSGKNIDWLIRNIKTRNTSYDRRIDELLKELSEQ